MVGSWALATTDPAVVVEVAGAVSGSTAGTTWIVVVVDDGAVVVDCGEQATGGPMHVLGRTTGWTTTVGVVDVVDVDVDVDVVDVDVGRLQFDPLSLLLDEPVAPSEPFQSVDTVTGPAGRDVEKVCVEPVQEIGVEVPLMVTVAELVPVDGNRE